MNLFTANGISHQYKTHHKVCVQYNSPSFIQPWNLQSPPVLLNKFDLTIILARDSYDFAVYAVMYNGTVEQVCF